MLGTLGSMRLAVRCRAIGRVNVVRRPAGYGIRCGQPSLTYPTSPRLTSKRRPRILLEVRSQGATNPRQGNTPTCLV